MNHNQYIKEQPGKLEAQFSEIRKTMFGENFWTTVFSRGPQGLLSIRHSITCFNIYEKVWD